MRLEKAQTSERFRPRISTRSTFRIGGAAHLTSLTDETTPTRRAKSGPVRVKPLAKSQQIIRNQKIRPRPDHENAHQGKSGGETGIRTLGGLAPTTVFETAPFDHSGTSPRGSGSAV